MSKENAENRDSTDTTATIGTELEQEIEGAVTQVVEQAEAERKAGEKAAGDDPATPAADDGNVTQAQDGQPVAGEAEDGKKADGDGGDTPESGGIPDDLIERAIRAGIPMKDAREFKSAEFLERMCGKLEEKAKPADGQSPGGEASDGKGDDDPLAGIPDLDPNEYDEDIVKGFKNLKDIIRKQQEMIAKLGEGTSRQGATIDSRLQQLGDAFAKAAPAGSEKRARLESKVNVLKAGYKAAGETIDEDAVFQEAVQLVLGDVQAEVSEANKAESLKKRKGLHLNRPTSAGFKPVGDVFAEVADELDACFSKN
jgi:hypothetical protein